MNSGGSWHALGRRKSMSAQISAHIHPCGPSIRPAQNCARLPEPSDFSPRHPKRLEVMGQRLWVRGQRRIPSNPSCRNNPSNQSNPSIRKQHSVIVFVFVIVFIIVIVFVIVAKLLKQKNIYIRQNVQKFDEMGVFGKIGSMKSAFFDVSRGAERTR